VRSFLRGIVSGLMVLFIGVGVAGAQVFKDPRYGIVSPFWDQQHTNAVNNLGAGSARFTLYWSLTNPSPGVFDWGFFDQHLDYSVGQLGLQVFVTVGELTPGWAGPCSTCSPYNIADWENYFEQVIRHAINRYPDARIVFGVWNEPNLGAFLQDDRQATNYAQLFYAADRARDRVSPNIRLGGPETSFHAIHDGYFSNAMNKIRNTLHAGDVVTVHWYPDSQYSIGVYMNAIANAAAPFRVWLTEAGGVDTCNDLDQWSGIAPILSVLDSGVIPNWQRVFIYHLRTTSSCGHTLINPNWTPRYSYTALANHYNTHVPSGILSQNQKLMPDEALLSPDRRFKLIYQSDGNLVLYRWDGVPLWHTSTHGTFQGRAAMQPDGNFVLYDGYGSALWHSFTFGNPGSYLKMQNDGNLVVYNPSNVPLWWSGTCCY
jgi:hypothetical protein